MKSRRAKACDISQRVKEIVWERDHHACIVCGSRFAYPSCHIVSRAHGGLGIETNIVTLCTYAGNDCHRRYDNGTKEEREQIDEIVVAYMKSIYGDEWSKEDQYYKKGGQNE